MKRLFYMALALALFASFSTFGQTKRIDSVFLHETFETNSATANSWGSQASTGCTSYNWQYITNSGMGALGSDRYAGYPGASASTGCLALLETPKIPGATLGQDDSIIVEFWMYRASVSTTDHLSIYIVDENGQIVTGPATVYVDETQSPAQNAGWNRLNWPMSYSALSSLSTSNFNVAFAGVSDNGANIFIDEVKIHHIYYQLIRNLKFTSDFTADTLTAGDKANVTWTESNVDIATLSYSSDGKVYNSIVLGGSPAVWTIPMATTNTGYLKLEDASDGTFFVLNGPFAIAWPEKLLNYNGGDSVMEGKTTNISWRSRNTVSTVDLAFSIDGGLTYATIAKGIASPTATNNSYPWTVPNVVSNTAKIKITGNDGSFVESNAYFKITHNSGIASIAEPGYFSYFPNPAHDFLNIQFLGKLSENTILNLYDVNGKLLISKTLASGLLQTSLDINGITKGIYFLEMVNNTSIIRKKVTVE